MNPRYTLLPILLLTLSICSSRAQDLLWSDEFNSIDGPDTNVWSYDTNGGDTDGFQVYNQANVEVRDFVLRLEPQAWTTCGTAPAPANDSRAAERAPLFLLPCANTFTTRLQEGDNHLTITIDKEDNTTQFTSGKIQSQGKLEVLYGRIEAKIKIPNPADGLWPAFSLLGSNGGSMTVMEMGSSLALRRGQAKSRVDSAVYWDWNGIERIKSNTVNTGIDLTGDFHLFSIDWTPEDITITVDDRTITTKKISLDRCAGCDEFHHPFSFNLDVAVGGTYTGIDNAAGITAQLPAKMLVDYIRIYDNGGFTELSGSAAPQVPVTTAVPQVPVTTAVPLPTTDAPVATTTQPLPTAPPTTTLPATTAAPTIETTVPTVPPTIPPTTIEPTLPPTEPPTLPPTTTPPTTDAPQVTTRPPSTESSPPDTTAAPTIETNAPIQNVQALGMVMKLTNAKPLGPEAQASWVKATEAHLTNQLDTDSNEFSVTQVDVTIISQDPPFQVIRRGLRRLETDQQQITFDVNYSIQSSIEAQDAANILTAKAFAHEKQKAEYLDSLKATGDAAFQDASFVSVESAAAVPESTGGGTTNTGLIVSIVCACLAVVVVGIVLYKYVIPRISRRPAKKTQVAPKQQHSSKALEAPQPTSTWWSDDDESMAESHPKAKKVVPANNIAAPPHENVERVRSRGLSEKALKAPQPRAYAYDDESTTVNRQKAKIDPLHDNAASIALSYRADDESFKSEHSYGLSSLVAPVRDGDDSTFASYYPEAKAVPVHCNAASTVVSYGSDDDASYTRSVASELSSLDIDYSRRNTYWTSMVNSTVL